MTETVRDPEIDRTRSEESAAGDDGVGTAATEQPSDQQPVRRTCPECDGRAVRDAERGDVACEDCGLVLDDDSIDRGPEWRSFRDDERDERSRVGAPTTALMHDKGLSTTIGREDVDAYGQGVADRKRARLARLRTWDERYRTKDARERNLKQALGEVQRMRSALGLSEAVGETAAVLYRRAVDEDLLPGRSIEGMASASLYAAARQHGTPRPLGRVADVSRVEELRVQRAYRYLARELELGIEPTDPAAYVPQFASALDVSEEGVRRARELLEAGAAENVHSGKSPDGLAAAALYAAATLTNEKLTQAEVSDAAGVCRVTIRDRYQELLNAYADRGLA